MHILAGFLQTFCKTLQKRVGYCRKLVDEYPRKEIEIPRIFLNTMYRCNEHHGSRNGVVVRVLARGHASPPTNVVQVLFFGLMPYVGWVWCWFLRFPKGFSLGRPVLLPSGKPTFQIPLQPGLRGTAWKQSRTDVASFRLKTLYCNLSCYHPKQQTKCWI